MSLLLDARPNSSGAMRHDLAGHTCGTQVPCDPVAAVKIKLWWVDAALSANHANQWSLPHAAMRTRLNKHRNVLAAGEYCCHVSCNKEMTDSCDFLSLKLWGLLWGSSGEFQGKQEHSIIRKKRASYRTD